MGGEGAGTGAMRLPGTKDLGEEAHSQPSCSTGMRILSLRRAVEGEPTAGFRNDVASANKKCGAGDPFGVSDDRYLVAPGLVNLQQTAAFLSAS